MVTCFLKYKINPVKIKEFENYGKLWIDLVNEMGGLHHGYLLPHEGANNVAYASFSFTSLAEYEVYRNKIPDSPKCMEAIAYAEQTQCFISYKRSFLKPVFEGISDQAKLFY
ncbi:NIPSNAP family protein [Pedobacter cryoconitis]|uniref:NIPSNAP family protein n=1 Tax=Pedobacter cryoconitis TaxID=188932 RepID=UPI0016197EF1|nr:NIPSNAP family protein [Pedobacter cryoconitis]MBB5645828.1 hypothetical protein [Pedobacter cryoconitis]